MLTTARRTIGDQGGVAMVITLMVLLILASLAMAFALLGASEPQIVANLQQSAEAMGLAEAGIEGVIWALNNPTVAPGGLAFPLPTTIPDPYNGNTDIGLGTGVFRVTVTAGDPARTEAVVTAEARVPSWASYRARKIVKATVTGLPYLNPPCAVCTRGDIYVKNNTIIDSRTSTTCGNKKASYSRDSTDLSLLANQTAYGLFANDAGPTVPNQATDYSTGVPASSFTPFTLTQAQIDFLKDLAKANETYYQGAVTLTSVPNGVVFVDTVSGNPIDRLNPGDFGSLTITGVVGSPKGWVVVMGNFSVSGEWSYSGLIYVANRLTSYHAGGVGLGDHSLSGAIIIQDVQSLSGGEGDSSFTTSPNNTTRIQYHCDNIRTGGFTYPLFFVKPGSWREQSG